MREGLRESHDCEFGRAIGRESGDPAQARGRGDVDDFAAMASFDHKPNNGAGTQKRAFDIHALNPIKNAFVQFGDGHAIRAGRRARVVDQNIDFAKMPDRVSHHLIDLIGAGHVGFCYENAPTQCADFRSNCGQPRPIASGIGGQIADGDIRALAGKAHRYCATDAAFPACAGDEGDFVFEIGHNFPFRVKRYMRRALISLV